MYKVLIVEDEDIIRKGLVYKVDWLKYNCMVVERAVDGVDGLEKIRRLQPDIVMTDIRMPFKDGIQMLEESKPEYDYEAIIISGYSEFEYAKQAISLGVNEYLLKPIDFAELHEAIMQITAKIEEKRRLKSYEQSFHDLNVYHELLDIQHYLYRDNKTKYVMHMLEYIKNNFHKKISLQDVSDHYQVSTVYLNAKFKEETNYTFNDFLNRYRIIKAVELLRKGDMLIYEVADYVGFQDYKYFSQVFKKYTGTSPTQFLEK
ncbi:response regulator [Brevibacillus sp. B_LB10_24]|uniref:response regulator transcription factor n=1 Tax=Brevibacillus sp. B_LB10_24 TaxID=3380645 RepID=UPI0038B84221